MSGLRSIPSEYAGVNFRSRAEARWAIAFDAADIKWVYEPEGYQLPTHWYLPDFWLPRMGCFAEVKGVATHWDEVAMTKATELAAHSGKHVLLLTDLMEMEDGIPLVPFVPSVIGGTEYVDLIISEDKERPFYHWDTIEAAKDFANYPAWSFAQRAAAIHFRVDTGRYAF